MHFTYYLTLTFEQSFGFLATVTKPYVKCSIAVYHHLFIYLFKLWFVLFFQYLIHFFGVVTSHRTGPSLAWSYFTHSEI